MSDASLVRFLRWLTTHTGGVDRLLLVGLLLVGLGGVAWGLANLIRELDSLLLMWMVVTGALIGWELAAASFSGQLAIGLVPTAGASLVLIHVGRLWGRLLSVPGALLRLEWELVRWALGGPEPVWVSVGQALIDLRERLLTLLIRARDWSVGMSSGSAAFDPVAAALVWGLVIWLASAWAGWVLRRRQRPLLALGPAGVVLGTTLSYAGERPHSFLVLLGAALLLLALSAYEGRVRRWQSANMDFVDPAPTMATAAILLSGMLVAAAAVAPSPSIDDLVEFARKLGEKQTEEVESFAGSLGVEQQPQEATALDAARSAGGLPRSHLLGSGPELSEDIVMIISTGDLPPVPMEALIMGESVGSPPVYYWRSHTYDRYTGLGWRTGPTGELDYDGGELVSPTDATARRTVRQKVRVIRDLGGLLHVAGALVTSDHTFTVAWRPEGDMFGASLEAPEYRADSLVSTATEDELLGSWVDYPEWIATRYLTLPDDVPDRVLALARDLTATEPTPYERARAIESYLRVFPYSLDIPAPPSDRDVADYFLFDLQQGYCDYYATAMVVLARAAGLPARLVVGYAGGSYDAYGGFYIVAEANAHAWPEIYFPRFGWVEFEPTAGLPPLQRDGEGPSDQWSEPEGALDPVEEPKSVETQLWLVAPCGLVLALYLGILWSLIDNWRLHHQSPATAVETIYRRMQRGGRRLAPEERMGDTPYEFAASLETRIAALSQEMLGGKALTAGIKGMRQLTESFVQLSYSPRRLVSADQLAAIEVWQGLRWRLWLANLRRWVQVRKRRRTSAASIESD